MTTIEAARPLDIAKKQISEMLPTFAYALPAFIPPARFVRILQVVVAQNPKLLECSRTSFFAACVECADLGLMPDGILGEAALVPLPDGTVGLCVMYKGLLKLARQDGDRIRTIFADIVYTGDTFAADPFRHEEPNPEADRGAPVRYYARARLETGEWLTEIVERADIERIRDATAAWKAFKAGTISDTPWETHFDALALKVPLMALCERLPQSDALRRALEIERNVTRSKSLASTC